MAEPEAMRAASIVRRASSFRSLAAACHPQPTVAVTAFTSALALGAGRRWGTVAVASAVLSGQLAVGWSNDYIDRDRDLAVHRTDKPIVAGTVEPVTVRNGALIAAAACVPLSLLSGWRAAAVHASAVGAGFAYNARLKSTAFSVAPYVAAFGVLPTFVSLGQDPPRLPNRSATIAAALMGAGAHFVNAVPDLGDDASTGVHGLPHRLGRRRSILAGGGLLATATAVVAGAGDVPLDRVGRVLASAALTTVGGIVVASRAGKDRIAWTLSLVAAASTVALYLARSDALT